jgi:hypothetical protein
LVDPYIDNQLTDDVRIRTFDTTLDEQELVWHRDKRNRKVEILDGKGWMFQFENGLPFPMTKGDTIEITKEQYHRVIKGDTPLKIKITEYGR